MIGNPLATIVLSLGVVMILVNDLAYDYILILLVLINNALVVMTFWGCKGLCRYALPRSAPPHKPGKRDRHLDAKHLETKDGYDRVIFFTGTNRFVMIQQGGYIMMTSSADSMTS
jgi:hypothetical protein